MNKPLLQTEIEEWLKEEPYGIDKIMLENGMSSFHPVKQEELEHWFSKWLNQLPQEQQVRAVEMIDVLMTYLSTFYQKKARCEKVEQEIIRQAIPLQSDLTDIKQMSELHAQEIEYVADKFRSRYGFFAMAQGSLAGTGHPVAMIADFPVLLVLNLKMIHYLAGCYGYSLNNPHEQVLALKVLHGASLPKKYRHQAWNMVNEHINTYNEGQMNPIERLIQPEWLETLAKQWVKSMIVFGMKRASRKKLPLLGMAYGASVNYQFTKQVSQFATYCYRQRLYHEKG